MAITRYEAASPVLASLVTVYLTGTQIAATIYADPLLTPLGNPFTSDALTGAYLFYADDGVAYDIVLGATGTPTPPPDPAVNNSFALLAVAGSQSLVADQASDGMQFIAGANVTLVGDATAKTLTISASGGGGTGLDQLTGDVTAGPGTGSQVATLANTAVTPGSYAAANITVDAKGRVTAAADGSVGPGGGITQLTGDGTAGPGSGSVVLTLANSGVAANVYGDATHVPQITVDAKGRITGVVAVLISGGGGGAGTVTNAAALTANRLVLGAGVDAVAVLGSLGTVTTVLHGNASGAPSFGAVANADMATMAASTVKANLAGSPATPSDASYAALASAMGVVVVPVPNASLATMPTGTVKANLTGGAAVPTDATYAALATAMNLVEAPFAADDVLDFGKAFIDLQILTSAPAAPAAGYLRFYAINNGGKVEWAVRFPTGAVQQVKIEA